MRKGYVLTDSSTLWLEVGDITRFEGDAIVNAANQQMLGGGGVDGAIHRAAGRGLLRACEAFPAEEGVRCPTGSARITSGYQLTARWVIHTVGPVYSNDERSAPLLESAYRSSLELANEKGLSSIAFPAISCGVYGYPLNKAARIALQTCQHHAGQLRDVTFVLFSHETAEVFLEAASAAFPEAKN